MFEEIINSIKEGNTEQAITLLSSAGQKYASLTEEISKSEAKVSDLISERNKIKSHNKLFKEKLGFVDNEEVNEDNILSKLKKSDSNDEIKKMEEIIKSLKSENEKTLEMERSKVLSANLDLEIMKRSLNLENESVNATAHQLIMDSIRKNATIEEGKIVYKDETGQVLRKDGLPISIEDRLNELKESHSFLFNAKTEQGYGQKTNSSTNSSMDGLSDFAKSLLSGGNK